MNMLNDIVNKSSIITSSPGGGSTSVVLHLIEPLLETKSVLYYGTGYNLDRNFVKNYYPNVYNKCFFIEGPLEWFYNYITELNMLLNNFDYIVIDTADIPKDAVRFGARVLVEELKNKTKRKVQLVGVDEIYDSEDEYERISIISPVGKPMIGKRVGDEFTVNAPIGKREFKILEIK